VIHQIVAIEKIEDGLRITDAAKRVYDCKTASDLWDTISRISTSTDMPSIRTEAGPRRKRGRISRRTTRQQEEDLRRVGSALINAVPEAEPALNLARDMLQQLGTLGRRR